MPNFEKSKGFKMEPKGLYKKQMNERGIPKYGLMEDTPTMKVTHLKGTKHEHTHTERAAHQDTPEAHNVPMNKMSDDIKMDRLMAKYKEPMAAHRPMHKYDDLPKYGKARNGSLMKKDYMLQASKAEVAAAKARAIEGGFDPEKADKVFKNYKKGYYGA